jgi:hypothetical protein
MTIRRIAWILLVLALVSSAAFGQSSQGTVSAGSTATQVALAMGAGWQQGGGVCRVTTLSAPGSATAARIRVSQTTGACKGRKIDYTVTVPFGTLVADHCYFIRPVCNELVGKLDALVDFEPLPSTCTTPLFCIGTSPAGGGANCLFDFGEIQVEVAEGEIPGGAAFGPRVAVALTVAFLAIGVFFLVRRGAAV